MGTLMMNSDKLISELFRAVDEKDIDKFCSYLHKNCNFRFGNLPVVSGLEEIQNFVSQFFDSINSLSHDIEEFWSTPDGIICHGTVTYIRHDNTSLTVPFSNILKISDEKINDYFIFIDTSLLYTNE